MQLRNQDIIYDWNEVKRNTAPIAPGFQLVDETLRDGIQSPSITNPHIEHKLAILHSMERLGIDVADVGLPGAGAQAVADVTRLVEEIRDQKMTIQPNCAARTHAADIQAVVDISQKTGVNIEVCAFLGSSPVRQLVENWDVAHMTKLVVAAADQCVKNGLPFSFVTEDTIRSHPETLRTLFKAAIDHGATRLILCDTVGHATPDGLWNLLEFTRGVVAETGAKVALDWHGHNDRALAVPLCLSALEFGIDRVHGTCLGVGERVGNASMDQILLNLRLLGVWKQPLHELHRYVDLVSKHYGVPVPYNYPAFGVDAFRTATGVHAAAIAKALKAGRRDLADAVYSSVPAHEVGCKQRIDIGFYSGKANVEVWLIEHELEPTEERVHAVLQRAKQGDTTLTDVEIYECLAHLDGRSSAV
ncbi:MAG: 2-isopropylmalate synthase [Deltaproteobacteria bacterium]|nr:2-isopropylmalate synthase [Deltaproteobacteria bacterium]